MKTKTHFQFRLDLWDAAGEHLLEHIAGLDDFDVATAALATGRVALVGRKNR